MTNYDFLGGMLLGGLDDLRDELKAQIKDDINKRFTVLGVVTLLLAADANLLDTVLRVACDRAESAYIAAYNADDLIDEEELAKIIREVYQETAQIFDEMRHKVEA